MAISKFLLNKLFQFLLVWKSYQILRYKYLIINSSSCKLDMLLIFIAAKQNTDGRVITF